MGFVILGHREDGDHRNRTLFAQLAAGALVHRREVGVEIAGIPAAPRNLLAGSRDFTQRLAVIGNIGQDDQHLHPEVEGEVFRGGKGHARGGNALDGRIVSEVQEQHRTLDRSGAGEVGHEKIGFLKGDADRRENDGKLAVLGQHPGLAGDLRRKLRVRQAGAGEDRQLLAAHQGVKAVDGGNAGLNKLGRVIAGGGVHRGAVDIDVFDRQDVGAAVNRFAETVKDAAEHVGSNPQLN